MKHEDIVDRLDRLIRINRDAGSGLSSAASHAKNSELETLFAGYAKRHDEFSRQLELEIERLGGTAPEKSGPGAIERGWMDLKSAITGHSTHALLTMCASGEESAVIEYQDAADAIATGQAHALIAKHHEQIKGFQKHLSRLADEVKRGLEFPANQ